jgi:hypothetical protein
MTTDGTQDERTATTDGPAGTVEHSKRPGEPDPGLDPRPYESSDPGPEAVQRGGGEERLLDSVGEAPTGDAVDDGAQETDDVEVELVNQPGQPNMGPPQTAPAPGAPRREHD